MEAIGDLYCVRCPHSNRIGIQSTTIPADQHDVDVDPQPLCGRGGGALRQQINRVMSFEIDEDGAVAVSPPPRPFVDPDDPRGVASGNRRAADQPQERRATGQDAKWCRESHADIATECHTDLLQRGATQKCLACIRCGQLREAFGEDAPVTVRIPTAEAPRAELQTHRHATPWEICKSPDVRPADPTRTAMTAWARSHAGGNTQIQDNRALHNGEIGEPKSLEVRKDRGQTHDRLPRDDITHPIVVHAHVRAADMHRE